ncbi:unnamed protein product [Clavelina lepadiformis]|uniref:N(6)-L-threonylcarbamoyladenine synthase n=1 Tax=Clavelina lepadiformis TaxID=159417 RepID=A0ABP0GGJ7_CLALP
MKFSLALWIYRRIATYAGKVNCRILSSSSSKLILGIESTFDDTGAAVVDNEGNVLGEALATQINEHVRAGGVDPRVAQKLHRKNLPMVVEDVMLKANVSYKELDAIATATKPGLPYCLIEGLNYSKKLIKEFKLPFIPIHHMEAHLLTPRMASDVQFPFLTLLASGGHCILCIAHTLGSYEILGNNIDEPPGAVLDKISRALKILERHGDGRMSNASNLEELALSGNKECFELISPFYKSRKRSCNFSFCGLQTSTLRKVKTRDKLGVGDADIAAWIQHCIMHHILTRVHRAIIFCHEEKFFKHAMPTLVVSGGVACNGYLRNALTYLCKHLEVNLVIPPLSMCTDNGTMIAWAGMEYLKIGAGISKNPMSERFQPKMPLGEHIGRQIEERNIRLPKMNYFN